MKLLKAKLKEAGEILRKIGEEEWVEAVRESREEITCSLMLAIINRCIRGEKSV